MFCLKISGGGGQSVSLVYASRIKGDLKIRTYEQSSIYGAYTIMLCSSQQIRQFKVVTNTNFISYIMTKILEIKVFIATKKCLLVDLLKRNGHYCVCPVLVLRSTSNFIKKCARRPPLKLEVSCNFQFKPLSNTCVRDKKNVKGDLPLEKIIFYILSKIGTFSEPSSFINDYVKIYQKI